MRKPGKIWLDIQNWLSMDSDKEKLLFVFLQKTGFCVTASKAMALSGNPFRIEDLTSGSV